MSSQTFRCFEIYNLMLAKTNQDILGDESESENYDDDNDDGDDNNGTDDGRTAADHTSTDDPNSAGLVGVKRGPLQPLSQNVFSGKTKNSSNKKRNALGKSIETLLNR
jgi:hypothetical protein